MHVGRFLGLLVVMGLLGGGPLQPAAFVVEANAANEARLKTKHLGNRTAYIPPQCYTMATDEAGRIHNPCFSCHTRPRHPNFIDDSDLQLRYSFPKYARTNHWTNLFEDRRERIAAISDAEIRDYVRGDNYLAADGTPILAKRLKDRPTAWDSDGDGRWSGYVPDALFQFDDEGFDRTPDGGYTGWRAFAYHPFLGAFWPTNGSTDDVLIRLPESFRNNMDGEFDSQVYKVNLAILEALFKEKDVPIEPIDERLLGGVDLDGSGDLGEASRIHYDWAPKKGRFMSFIGQARKKQAEGDIHLAAGLFPEGTEFLHSVRYLDVEERGEIGLTPRMKELRYARKGVWFNYSDLYEDALAEIKEKNEWPDKLRRPIGDLEQGVNNGKGWVYQGFIEDAGGALRPQTFEETVFCIGCHGGIGANQDGIFSFGRKLDATTPAAGWYHWSQRGIKGLPERIRSDGLPELSYYLKQNGAGDEFRENAEVIHRFFDAGGELKEDRVADLRDDISRLLWPSPERALLLNKAYRTIVLDQSFRKGRDTIIAPARNVYRKVEEDKKTGIAAPVLGY